MADADILTREAIWAVYTPRLLGREMEIYREIDSTNTRAVTLAQKGAPEGLLVLADHQTQGRGRLGRQWFAPPGSSLLFSLLLRPPLAVSQAQRATMVCTVAMVEAIAEVTGLKAQIKWPNDILLCGGKLGGVLTELGARGAALEYAVVGMGLNVNLDLASLPPVMTPPASLSAALGRKVPRAVLLGAFLRHAEALYEALKGGWSPYEVWREHLATLGQRVAVGTAEEVIEGLAKDVDADGALLIRTDAGDLRRILAGDVTLRGERL